MNFWIDLYIGGALVSLGFNLNDHNRGSMGLVTVVIGAVFWLPLLIWVTLSAFTHGHRGALRIRKRQRIVAPIDGKWLWYWRGWAKGKRIYGVFTIEKRDEEHG